MSKIEELVNDILEKSKVPLNKNVLIDVVDEILPMLRPTDDVLNSIRLDSDQKQIIKDEIDKFGSYDFDKLIQSFFSTNDMVLDCENRNDYYGSGVGNALMVVYLNEMIERLDK